MFKLIMGIGIVAAICLAGIGCGSGGDEATSAPLTKAQFIKQADAICAKFAKKREAAFDAWKENFPGGIEEAQYNSNAGFKEVVAPSVKQQAEALETLVVSEKDEAKLERMTGNLLKASEAFAEEGGAGMQHPGMSEFEHETEAYGMKKCPYP